MLFHPNEIDEGRSIMTDWIGRVYEEVKRSGKNKELAIRLPDRIEDCMNAGLDPETWVQRGIVDVLIPEMLDDNYRVKISADYSEYTKLVDGTDCRVLGTVNSSISTDRLSEAPISMIRAVAMNAWEQGVDGLYVSEWFQLWPYESGFYEKLRELPYPQIMDSKDKYYFIPKNDGRFSNPANQLPKKMELKELYLIKKYKEVDFFIKQNCFYPSEKLVNTLKQVKGISLVYRIYDLEENLNFDV